MYLDTTVLGIFGFMIGSIVPFLAGNISSIVITVSSMVIMLLLDYLVKFKHDYVDMYLSFLVPYLFGWSLYLLLFH